MASHVNLPDSSAYTGVATEEHEFDLRMKVSMGRGLVPISTERPTLRGTLGKDDVAELELLIVGRIAIKTATFGGSFRHRECQRTEVQ